MASPSLVSLHRRMKIYMSPFGGGAGGCEDLNSEFLKSPPTRAFVLATTNA